MRKTLVVFIVALLCIAACGCQTETPPHNDGGIASAPISEQLPIVVRRPAHDLQTLMQIVGWYEYTYSENARYPTKVVRQDLKGNVEETYELVFDENGIPYEMILFQRNGKVSPYQAELFCDKRGNICEARIFDEEGKQLTQYRLTYDENGRMVTTKKIKEDLTLTLDYDAHYHLTHVTWLADGAVTKYELAYDEEHQLTKRLIVDKTGVLSGWEKVFNDAGDLLKYCSYKNSEVVSEKHYDEKERLTEELYRSSNGQIHRILMEYDLQDRVIKTTLLLDEALASWTEIFYQENVYTHIVYDDQGNITGKNRTETDDEGNVLEKIVYGDHDNVLQHDTYTYNAQGNVIEQKNYTYKEDGTLKQGIEYVYDDEGEELSHFRYAAGGSFQGYEKIVDGNGDLIQQRTYGIDGNYFVRDYIPGTLLCTRDAKYSAEGVLLSFSEYTYEDGKRRYTIEHAEDGSVVESFYNNAGRYLKEVCYDPDGEVTSSSEWTYHESGKVATVSVYRFGKLVYYSQHNDRGSAIREVEYDGNGNAVSTRTWEYTYYADGKVKKSICTIVTDEIVTAETEYYEDGKRKSFATYAADGTLIDISFYDEEGHLIPYLSRL